MSFILRSSAIIAFVKNPSRTQRLVTKFYWSPNVKKFALLLVAVSVALTGCMSSPFKRMNLTNLEVIDFPAVGQLTTRNLGERLVAKGVRTKGEALEVKSNTTFGHEVGEFSATCAMLVLPSTQFYIGVWQTKRVTADCYGPFNMQSTHPDGSTDWNCPGRYLVGDICQDRSTAQYFITLGGQHLGIWLKRGLGNLAVTEKVSINQASYVQELLYNGRSGDILKFIYREFAGNLMRPAFTQDVQYDLSKSTEIGFKSARIEVFSATNTDIKYKLLNNFED